MFTTSPVAQTTVINAPNASAGVVWQKADLGSAGLGDATSVAVTLNPPMPAANERFGSKPRFNPSDKVAKIETLFIFDNANIISSNLSF